MPWLAPNCPFQNPSRLSPDEDLAKAYAILDDRARPYYEHRMAA